MEKQRQTRSNNSQIHLVVGPPELHVLPVPAHAPRSGVGVAQPSQVGRARRAADASAGQRRGFEERERGTLLLYGFVVDVSVYSVKLATGFKLVTGYDEA
jgi:hypothetical protein